MAPPSERPGTELQGGRGVFDLANVLRVSFGVDQSFYSTNMCALSIWVSLKALVYGLGEVSRVLADGRETYWYCFLNTGVPVIGRVGKPRASGAILVCTNRSWPSSFV